MKNKLYRLVSLHLVSVMLLGFLVACAPAPSEPAPSAGVSFPLEIVDQAGRLVRIEKIPEKIISLAPSNTEILYALGLEERLVGVTEYCDYPEAAKDKPKIGGFSTVDIERVIEIEPDLILAVNIHKKEIIPGLERLGLTVVCLDPTTLEEVLAAITLVGQCTGEADEAARLVSEMRHRIEAITSQTANLIEAQKPKVFVIMWHDPLNSTLLGLRHNIIVKAGGINIAEELGGASPTVTLEWIIDTNPEVIIASVGMGTGEDLTYQFVLNEERLAVVDARINNRVYQIDLDLFGRPGPRIVQGLEQVAKMIHPEIFGEVE